MDLPRLSQGATRLGWALRRLWTRNPWGRGQGGGAVSSLSEATGLAVFFRKAHGPLRPMSTLPDQNNAQGDLTSMVRSRKSLTAFSLILQTIAVWLYPPLFAAGFLERVTVCDHTQVNVPSPVIARHVLIMATDGLILTSG